MYEKLSCVVSLTCGLDVTVHTETRAALWAMLLVHYCTSGSIRQRGNSTNLHSESHYTPHAALQIQTD